MPDPAIVVEHYSFWYDTGQGTEALALDDVSLEIAQGEFLLVLGQSGAGKSTLALNLVGIYPDYFGGRNEGRVLVNHATKGLVNRRELEAGERFATVNMLFQNPEDQMVTLSVEEEVGFALENYLVPPDEIHQRIDASLDLVGLNGFRDRSIGKLSGGEKQRVALAAMLAMQPRVLILDEPTSNLDPIGTRDVLDAVSRIREQGDLTVLIVEHEVDEVFDQVDKVILVDGKHVHGPDAPRAFLDRHGLDVRDRMGLWIPQAAEVAMELRTAGIELPVMPLNGAELVDDLAAIANAATVRDGPAPVPPAHGRPPAGDAVIEVRDLSFSYPSKPDVLRGIDLQIRRGELLAIVGQNGSGKSTLAAHLNGILKPTAGEVLFDGRRTTDYRFAELVRRVAFIFQMPEKQFIRNNVHDEMAHGLQTLKLPEEEIERRVEEFLTSVRLLDRRDVSPYVLSHGQKRRLSVACMVINDPDVVVLDEPTFGQDYQQARRLMDLLGDLVDGGAAAAFITHDMRLVAEYADRCVALTAGEKIFDGTAMELFGDEDVLRRAQLKRPPIYQLAQEVLGEPMLDLQAFHTRIQEMASGGFRSRI